ncbi:MAG: VOC family protein [Actinomycetota bacterium]|nr:VOC family protein [Actinomycetota bacterium]
MIQPTMPALGDVIERFDHVSVAVRDIRAALPLVELMAGQFRDGGNNQSGEFRWVQFDLPGAGKLEMIEPLDHQDTNNFLVRFLDANGDGIHHVTLKVTSIEAAIECARGLGMEVVGVDLSYESWKEAFIHPKSANGVLVQIAEWIDQPASGRKLEDVIGEDP